MNLRLVLTFAFVSAPLLLAQHDNKVIMSDGHEFGPIGITTAIAGPMSTVTGAPYTAEAVTEHTQTLADGNRIHHTITSQVARDSQGRIRREESLPGLSDGPHLIMIDDPIAGVHWTLNPSNKTAFKMPVKRVVNFANPPGPAHGAVNLTMPTEDAITISVGGAFAIRDGNGASETEKTSLGTQMIEGVPAQGTKLTHTIAPGEVGNDQPIVITTETWMSPDLKVLVMSKTSDPRMGETSYRLTNILRADPDPALFQVPSDYTIQEKPSANTIFFNNPAKPE